MTDSAELLIVFPYFEVFLFTKPKSVNTITNTIAYKPNAFFVPRGSFRGLLGL